MPPQTCERQPERMDVRLGVGCRASEGPPEGYDSDSWRVVFVDALSLTTLAHILWHRRSVNMVWHFEPVTPMVSRWLNVCRHLSLIRAQISQVTECIGHVRDRQGNGAVMATRQRARQKCVQLVNDRVARNPLIQRMSRIWNPEKLLLHFDRLIETTLLREYSRVSLVDWLLRSRLHMSSSACVVLLAQAPWRSEVTAYARERRIRVVTYANWWGFWVLLEAGARLCRALMRVWPIALRALRSRGQAGRALSGTTAQDTGEIPVRPPTRPTVGLRYWYRPLSFDPGERSEFFWLDSSGIPPAHVLLYDYVPKAPLGSEIINQLRFHRIRLLCRRPGRPIWRPTWRTAIVACRTVARVAGGWLICAARGQRMSLWYPVELLALAIHYAYWYDFFESNHVKLNVGTMNTPVAQMLALEALGGVGVAYQYSVSGLATETSLLASGGDVQFVFSPAFEQLCRSLGSPAVQFIHTGFIYDGAFAAVRERARTQPIRRTLEQHGAQYVIGFFDEASVNRWNVEVGHEDAAKDYGFLLRWLLEDPTLGIIFKPKKFVDLFDRIGSVSRLVEEARQTGRCVFLESDTIVGRIFPAEAALQADVCIGKLTGGTAALEARLAGIPTILVDTEGLSAHAFYRWGSQGVVFRSWADVRRAVEQFRRTPEMIPGFGDWSAGIQDLDPFRDGHATRRMGSYIGWLYEALARGASKQEALAIAAERYARQWGKGEPAAYTARDQIVGQPVASVAT